MKRFVLMLALSFALLGAVSANAERPFIFVDPVTEDTAGGGDWFSLIGGADTDTSQTYTTKVDWWEEVSIQYRFTARGVDSVRLSIHYQGSNDGTNWFFLDSTASIVDSSQRYDQVLTKATLPVFRRLRMIVLSRADNHPDSSYGTIFLMARGNKP